MRSTKNGQGGGGGGTPRSIAGTGGGVNADSAPGIIDGVTIGAPAGKHLWLNVPDVLFGAQQAGLPLVARVPISSAELLALHLVPKVLVPAAGLGTIVYPVTVLTSFTPGAAAFRFDATPGQTPMFNARFLPVGGGSSDVDSQFASSVMGQDIVDPGKSSPLPQLWTIGPNMTGLATIFTDAAFALALDFPLTLGNGTLTVTLTYLVLR